jgi:hypothetical protein
LAELGFVVVPRRLLGLVAGLLLLRTRRRRRRRRR